jgi:ABC-type transport system involved in multi-copper enzyme maturation permease subunit
VLGVARTQYLELTRQPVFGVVLAFGAALVALSPALAVFSIGRAEALVLDLGASTTLFFCVFLAAVAVAAGAAERLSDGTTALVLTHPVGSLTVLTGQFLGASLALAQAGVLLTVVLLGAVRNGPDRLHMGVLLPALVALSLAIAWGVKASIAHRNFQAAAVAAATVLFPVAFVVGLTLTPAGTEHGTPGIALDDALQLGVAAGTLAVLASLPFAALGLALSTRVGAGATATLTLLAFLLASLVQGPLAPPEVNALVDVLDPRHLTVMIPDLQLYWIGDAGYAGNQVPLDYVVQLALASGLYAAFALALGAVFLDGRELGRG